MFWLLVGRIDQSNKDVLLLLINSLTAFVSLVLGFYFGSMEKNGEAATPSGDFDDPDFPDVPAMCPHCGKSLISHGE